MRGTVAAEDEGGEVDHEGDEDGDEEEDDSIPGSVSNNPFVKSLKGRAKTCWRYWWKTCVDDETKKEFERLAAMKNIGQATIAVREMFMKLSEEDQAEWARKAAEASKLPVDQWFMYVREVLPRARNGADACLRNQGGFNGLLMNMLLSVVGLGPLQIGMAAFHVQWGVKDKQNKIHYYEYGIFNPGFTATVG